MESREGKNSSQLTDLMSAYASSVHFVGARCVSLILKINIDLMRVRARRRAKDSDSETDMLSLHLRHRNLMNGIFCDFHDFSTPSAKCCASQVDVFYCASTPQTRTQHPHSFNFFFRCFCCRNKNGICRTIVFTAVYCIQRKCSSDSRIRYYPHANTSSHLNLLFK